MNDDEIIDAREDELGFPRGSLSEVSEEATGQSYRRAGRTFCDTDTPGELVAEFMPATHVKPRSPEWFWQRRVVRGDLNILAGTQGVGKSQVSTAIAAAATRAKKTALIVSGEDDPETTIVPRLIAADADLEFVWIAREGIDFFVTDPERLRDRIRRYGAEFVVIDPLLAFVPVKVDSHKDQHVRSILAPVRAVASEESCTILGLMHLKKGQEREAVNAVGGSIAWTAAPRSTLLVTRHEDREQHPDRRILFHAKCNVGREQAPLEFDIDSLPYGAVGRFETSRIRWVGEADHDLDAALGHEPPKRTKADAARDWLIRELSDGPVDVDVLQGRFADAQIASFRTLETAKKAAGVLSRQVAGGWVWELP